MNVSTRVAAEILGVTTKRVDNLLVRLRVELGLAGVQGRSRVISQETVELLAVSLLLNRDTGASMSRAMTLAREIIRADKGTVPLGALASLHFDVARLRALLQQALADALEDQSAPRRGRPPMAKN
jgi:hypothetical protein